LKNFIDSAKLEKRIDQKTDDGAKRDQADGDCPDNFHYFFGLH
jgi:hypothetical protein